MLHRLDPQQLVQNCAGGHIAAELIGQGENGGSGTIASQRTGLAVRSGIASLRTRLTTRRERPLITEILEMV